MSNKTQMGFGPYNLDPLWKRYIESQYQSTPCIFFIRTIPNFWVHAHRYVHHCYSLESTIPRTCLTPQGRNKLSPLQNRNRLPTLNHDTRVRTVSKTKKSSLWPLDLPFRELKIVYTFGVTCVNTRSRRNIQW